MDNVKIEDVYQDGACCNELGMGMALSVDLDNGSCYTIFLDSKAKEPLFYDVVRNKCGKPKTDGKCVCWSNGATLSLQEMFDMLQAGKEASFSASRV